MDIERADGCLTIKTRLDGNDSGAGRDRKMYGFNPGQFRDMVIGLVLQNFLTSEIGRLSSMHSDNDVAQYRTKLFRRLTDGQEVSVYMTHPGRVHLWNQRDALLRDPDLEPFGLRSRAAWERDLFLRLRWATPQEPLSLMFLDLDNFGRVNKQYGHPIGDAVLRLVFGLVNSFIGNRGAAYRYGGEEVGVLLPGADRTKAVGIAEELRKLIECDVHVKVPELGVPQTATIGVAEFTDPMRNDAAVSRAETPVRQAKLSGNKNRVVVEDGAASATVGDKASGHTS